MPESTGVTTTAPTTPTTDATPAGSKDLRDRTMGINLADRHSDLCAINRDSEVLEDSRLPTTPLAFRQCFASIPRTRIAREESLRATDA